VVLFREKLQGCFDATTVDASSLEVLLFFTELCHRQRQSRTLEYSLPLALPILNRAQDFKILKSKRTLKETNVPPGER
jgi:hypothetical protein